MREQITFFDFFESFVPPRELRLLFWHIVQNAVMIHQSAAQIARIP